jgi:hypothetical protein
MRPLYSGDVSPDARSARLRTTGRILLACGVVLAAIVYAVAASHRATALDDSNALGYTRAMDGQMARLMGHFGVLMMGWDDALASPLGKALSVLAVAGLFAAYFFRVAWVHDEEERERRHDEHRARG